MLAIGTKPSGLRCSYWWGLHDRDGLHDFLLVRLRAGTVEIANNRGHTSLVTHGGSQVDWLLGVILGETGRAQVSWCFSRLAPALRTWKLGIGMESN